MHVIQLDLRPLRIGEILDRAVTLFVRRFAVLVLILALVAIPIAICQYIAQPQMTGFIEDLQRVLAAPPGQQQDRREVLTQLIAHNRVGQSGLALIVAAVILGTLSSTACIIAVAQSYAGKVPSVREVYRAALRRWLAQLVALGFFVVLAFAIFIGLLIIVFFIALSVGALTAASRTAALFVGIPAGIILAFVMFALIALMYFATQMSLISIALEDANPIHGIATGLRRTLGAPIFWRSLLVATIVFAVAGIGQLLIVSIAGALSVATHVSALYPVLAVVGGIVLNALVTTFIVIYAVDIRVRREGYDLALAAHESTL